MQAGKLRHRVTIEERSTSAPGDGSYGSTWTAATNGTVYASIEPLQGRELWEARQVGAKVTHRVRMRYWPGLTSEHRLNFGGRILNLLQPPINVREKNVEFELLCRESEDKSDG